MPVDGSPERLPLSVDVRPFLGEFVCDLNCCHQKLSSTFGAFLQRFSQVENKTLYRHAALSGQPSQHRKIMKRQQWKYFHQQ
jgi:hypothetical protein